MAAGERLDVAVFLVLYRRRPGRRATYVRGERLREAVWLLVPVLVVLVLDLWLDFRGAPVWARVKIEKPAAEVVIQITGKQFNWEVLYPRSSCCGSSPSTPCADSPCGRRGSSARRSSVERTRRTRSSPTASSTSSPSSSSGFSAPRSSHDAEEQPAFLFPLVILYVAFEVFIFAVVLLLARWVFDELAGWAVVVGNLLAAAGMLAYYLSGHPRLARQVKAGLAEERG